MRGYESYDASAPRPDRHAGPLVGRVTARRRAAVRTRRRTAAVAVCLAGNAILVPVALPAALAQPPAAATVAPAPAPARDDDAPIGPGDKVVLRVWREPTWSDAFPVDGAGDATLPRIGVLRVAGLRPSALKDTVRTRLAVYLREPVVDVIILRRVAVLGAVKKPDVLFVEPVTTLRDVLAQAGGIAEDGNPDKIEILRGGQRIRLGRWSEIASTAAPVQSGDQVIVGRSNWISRNALAVVSSVAVAASVILSAVRR